jgi:hypothetical protein
VSVYELLSLPVIVTVVAFVAVTVRMDELPAVIEVGLAVIVTVGAWFPVVVTVTVAVAVADPPAPVAVAVYVVVWEGLTDCVPPVPGSV